MAREMRIGSPDAGGVVVGDVRVPVVAGVAGGGDVTRVVPGTGYERAGDGLAAIRDRVARPLLVDIHDSAQRAAVTYADGVVVPTGAVETARVAQVAAARRLPVIIRREPEAGVDDWIAAAETCSAAGVGGVALCEGGGARREGGPEPGREPQLGLLSRVRERTDVPVFVDVSAVPHLIPSAVTARADGIIVAADASVSDAAQATELVATVAAFGRMMRPDSLDAARQAIDQVDAGLANLLERRCWLAGIAQRMKPVGGFAGRDPGRERDLVTAMARRAPRLGTKRVRRIMAVIIEAGLDLAESDPPGEGANSDTPNTCPSGGRSRIRQ